MQQRYGHSAMATAASPQRYRHSRIATGMAFSFDETQNLGFEFALIKTGAVCSETKKAVHKLQPEVHRRCRHLVRSSFNKHELARLLVIFVLTIAQKNVRSVWTMLQ